MFENNTLAWLYSTSFQWPVRQGIIRETGVWHSLSTTPENNLSFPGSELERTSLTDGPWSGLSGMLWFVCIHRN